MQHHIIHEALDYKALLAGTDYKEWLGTGTYEMISDLILTRFTEYKLKGSQSTNIQFSVKGGSSAFVFKNDLFSYHDLKNFQLVLLSRLKNLSYIVNLAEQKSNPQQKEITFPNLVYYLKPSVRLSFGRKQAVQLFGNIHIECVYNPEGPSFLRFIAHTYNDRNYEAARDFSDLMTLLFEKVKN
jgi:hypothetical protein